jgi:hypothetical protein
LKYLQKYRLCFMANLNFWYVFSLRGFSGMTDKSYYSAIFRN